MSIEVNYRENGMSGMPIGTNPDLIRSGWVTEEIGEMTPFLYRGELMLFGSAKSEAEANPFGERCLWIENVASRRVATTFARGYGLGSAYCEGHAAYVYAIPNDSRGANHIDCFISHDMSIWSKHTVLKALPGEELFNESICKAGDRYIMAYESRDARYPPFTIFFAESNDLINWMRIPGAVYGTDRYTACPTIRFIDGMFYMLYLEHLKPAWWFETYVARSTDLIHWEQGSKNPVLKPEGAEDINASDVDLVESDGKVFVYYAYGDQKSSGAVTWAEYEGPLPEFFRFYFS